MKRKEKKMRTFLDPLSAGIFIGIDQPDAWKEKSVVFLKSDCKSLSRRYGLFVLRSPQCPGRLITTVTSNSEKTQPKQ